MREIYTVAVIVFGSVGIIGLILGDKWNKWVTIGSFALTLLSAIMSLQPIDDTVKPTPSPTSVTPYATVQPTASTSYPPTPLTTPFPSSEISISRSSDLVSQLTKLTFSGASATSELKDDYGTVWGATKAIDGDPKTNWQEWASGYGIGESLTLYFNAETTVSYIEIYPGFVASDYGSSDYVFHANGRPSALKFEFSDGSSCKYTEFKDKIEGVLLKLSRPVSTSYIRITILDVYKAEYEDTAISEVSAYN